MSVIIFATSRQWAQGFAQAPIHASYPKTNTCEDLIFNSFACDRHLLFLKTLRMKAEQKQIQHELKYHSNKWMKERGGDGLTRAHRGCSCGSRHAPTGQGDWLAARQATDSCVTTADNLRMGGTSSSRKVASKRKHFILDSIYWPIRFGS